MKNKIYDNYFFMVENTVYGFVEKFNFFELDMAIRKRKEFHDVHGIPMIDMPIYKYEVDANYRHSEAILVA